MKIREFKKTYGDQIAGGQKTFNYFFILIILASYVFRTVWLYNHDTYSSPSNKPLFIYILGMATIFVGIVLGSLAQMFYDIRIKRVISDEIKPYYLKYVAVKGILGFLIPAGILSLVYGFMVFVL